MNNKKIISNASWIIFAQIIKSILAAIITMMTARYLGPSNFGSINYAASIVAFVVPFLHLGLTSTIVQEFVNAPEKDGTILGSSLLACGVSSILCIIGIFSFILVANHGEKETIIVCLLYSLVLFIQVFDVLKYWFQSKLLSKYTSIVALFSFFVVSIYKAFLLITDKSIYWFAISNSLDYLLIVIASIYLYKRLGGGKLHFSKDLLFKMLNKSKYYIISDVMIAVFAQTDRIMLKLMIDEAATGYYSAAVSCAGMTAFIFGAIRDSCRPVIFESMNDSETSFENNMCRLYSITIYMTLIQSIVITLFAKIIIYILYGQEYMIAVGSLRIVIWYTTFSYLGAVRNIWILAQNKQRLIWRIDLSGAVANVILNFLLIPNYGIYGASIATLLTQFFTNIVMVAIIKDVRPNIRLMIKSLSPKWIVGIVKSL